MENRKILLATGGTGGHVFPAIAAGAELKTSAQVFYVSDARGKKYIAQDSFTINSASFSGGLFKKIFALLKILFATIRSIFLVKKIDPDVVVGFGGYASFPVVLAAILLGKKTMLHEQNSVIGRANKMLARRVDILATGFKKIQNIHKISKEKIKHTGNPVRFEFKEKTQSEKFNIFVIGGSQGAKIFTKLLEQFVTELSEEERTKIHITQQAKPEDISKVSNFYDIHNVSCEIKPFFDDVKKKYEQADFIIARAGASTVAEIMHLKKPSVLIPYIYAADNHQFFNAKFLSDKNLAFLLEEKTASGLKLAEYTRQFLDDENATKDLKANYEKLKNPDAAKKLAKLILNL